MEVKLLPRCTSYGKIRLIGELAQLVERCDRTAEVRDSSSLFSIELMSWLQDCIGRALKKRSQAQDVK